MEKISGIDQKALEEAVKSIDWAEFERKRQEKQENCPHEGEDSEGRKITVHCFGPSWRNGIFSHEGYFCSGCGLNTDYRNPIGKYRNQRVSTNSLNNVFYEMTD